MDPSDKDQLLTEKHIQMLAIEMFSDIERATSYRLDHGYNEKLRRRVAFDGDKLPPIQRLTHESYFHKGRGYIIAVKVPPSEIYHAAIAVGKYAADNNLVGEYVLHYDGVAVFEMYRPED